MGTPTQAATVKAVHGYMAANYDSLLARAATAHGPALDAMFAEIDRNLDASEKLTAQLLARDESIIRLIGIAGRELSAERLMKMLART